MIGLMANKSLQVGDQVIFKSDYYEIVEIGNVERPEENLKLVYVKNITPKVKKTNKEDMH